MMPESNHESPKGIVKSDRPSLYLAGYLLIRGMVLRICLAIC